MIFNTTAIKVLCALISLGSLSAFSYLSNQENLLVFYIFFIAQSTLLVSFADLGSNALNSSIGLERYRAFTPKFLKSLNKFYLDILAVLCAGSLLWYFLKVSIFLIILCILYIFLRIFIMRWITISRKDVSPLFSIIYGDLFHAIINAFSLVGLYFSKESFLVLITFGLTLQVLMLSQKPLGSEIISDLLRIKSKQYIQVSIFVLLQSYLSAFKNNLVGILLGFSSSANLATTFIANRSGQIYAIAMGGMNNILPYRLKNKSSLIANDLYSYILITVPIIFILVCLFFPSLISFVISKIFNYQPDYVNNILLSILVLPYLVTSFNNFLIAKGLYKSCVAVDIFVIILILIFIVI